MVYAFRIISPALPSGAPASDLDGEVWTFQDLTLESATSRALRRLEQTFCYASADRRAATQLDFVGEYPSMKAYDEAADTLPAPAASGVALTSRDADAVIACVLAEDIAAAPCKRHDFSDGDVCSRCDAMRGVA